MPNARINLTVTNFKDINAAGNPPRWTEIGDPVIPAGEDGGDRVFIKTPTSPGQPKWIGVKKNGPVDLEFTLLPANNFFPIGIGFRQTSGNQDPRGKDNFDLISISGATFTIRNKKVQSGGARWELYIMIQDANGAIGIIDPGIENEN